MTARRDLKKRVRARQSRTGERYTTALKAVLAQQPRQMVPVVELLDLSAVAAELGLTGRVVMFPGLASRVEPRVVLQRVHEVLRATEGDPDTRLFRAVLLDGEGLHPEGRARLAAREARLMTAILYGLPYPVRRGEVDLPGDGGRFLERARAGIGGVSESGLILAVPVPAREGMETVVCMVWGLPITPAVPWVTSVVLRSAHDGFADIPELEALIHRTRGEK